MATALTLESDPSNDAGGVRTRYRNLGTRTQAAAHSEHVLARMSS